ncbi:MAG: dephospho-CoA kinase [Patiriisocius sp.]|jgi:dephospho-CoA kinase
MVIGIAGSFGAGKGAVVDYLISKKKFKHYSASGFITEEIERQGLPVDRDSMTIVANDLRKAHGPSYIIESLYQRALENGGNVVIESLRAVAEVRMIKELGGVVLGVDADAQIRYDRSQVRGSIKDGVSFEKWAAQEKEESNPEDPTKQNIFGALAEADYVVTNNDSFENLHTQIEDVLQKI